MLHLWPWSKNLLNVFIPIGVNMHIRLRPDMRIHKRVSMSISYFLYLLAGYRLLIENAHPRFIAHLKIHSKIKKIRMEKDF